MYFASALVFLGCGTTKQVADKPQKQEIKKSAPKDPIPFAETITKEELKEILYVYASDEFKGRNTGDLGQKMAVEFLKAKYTEMGIPAAQGGDNYFQEVPLVSSSLTEGTISINKQNFEIGTDAVTFDSYGNKMHTFQQIAYVGYGIDEPGYSDYNGMEVKGKLLVIKSGEPMTKDSTYIISGTKEPSLYSDLRQAFRKKMETAKKKGATGVLFYEKDNFGRLAMQYTFMKGRASGDNMKLKTNEESFLYFFVDDKLAKTLKPDIDTDNKAAFLKTEAMIGVRSDIREIKSENVVSYIKGSEFPNEYVVISAHLDHVGVDKDGKVFNGADDDGSGTSAVLEIAEAFKKAYDDGQGPRRSVVFLNVTGEEKGLLGSEYYSENPVFPLEQTVVDLNIDMVGRIDPAHKDNRNYVYLIGADKLSTELHKISEIANEKYTHFQLDYTYNDENDPNRFYYRSDHYNFAKHNVPIIFYFNGTHEDYHQVTDTPDKIDYELLERRAQLVFYTAWEIANKDTRLIVDKAVQAP